MLSLQLIGGEKSSAEAAHQVDEEKERITAQ